MLFSIPASLPAELLQVLAAMGHGDELLICDANYPAVSTSRKTQLGHVIEIIGHDAPTIVSDVLKLMPLDAFDDAPVMTMAVVGDPDKAPIVHREVSELLRQVAGNPWPLIPLERFAFYERAAQAFAIVRTTERRPFGNFILKKGVLRADGELMTPEFASQVE